MRTSSLVCVPISSCVAHCLRTKSGPTMYSQDRYVKSDSISRQALDRPQDDPLYIVRINRCQVLYPKFAEASVGVQGIRHVQLHIHPPSEASDIGGL